MPETQDHAEHLKRAAEQGYNDAYFDGVFIFPDGCPCSCRDCDAAYEVGFAQGLNDLQRPAPAPES